MIGIEYEEILKKFSKVIKKDDEIRNYDSKMTYVKIEEVEYIEEPEKKILINGIMNRSNYSFYIKAKDTIELHTRDFERMELINKMSCQFEDYKIYRESISNANIKNESFRILKEYMDKKKDKIVYGYDVISNIEINNVKVVFVSWSFVKNLKGKWFEILTNKENKYKDINIVVFGKDDENYKEIKNNGGIIGVIY